MKSRFFLLLLTLTLLFPLASGYHREAWFAGQRSHLGAEDTYFYGPQPGLMGSAAYNYRRFGVETGYNPFFAKGTPALNKRPYQPRSHMDIRNELDYQTWKNPDLLAPRHSTNYDRFLRGFGPNQFKLYHSDGFTGRIRTGAIHGQFDY